MTIITRSGDETQVNTTTEMGQVAPQIIALANGQYIVAWADNVDATAPARTAQTDIRAQLFDADGTRAGDEFIVTNASGMQFLYDALQLDNGNILFTWQQRAGTAYVTYHTQEFSVTGAALSGPTQIGTPTISMREPSMTALDGGGYVVLWNEYIGANTKSLVQIYDATNTPVGEQITVDYGTMVHRTPLISANQDGGFSITRLTQNFDIWGSLGVTTQQYSSSGIAVGTPVSFLYTVGLDEDFSLYYTQFTKLPDGNLVGITQSNESDGSTQTVVSLFDSLGNIVNVHNLDNIDIESYAVTAIANGGFALTWHSALNTEGLTDGSGAAIHAAFFSAHGNPIFVNEPGAVNGQAWEIIVNSRTEGNQFSPDISTLANGNIVISWSDYGEGDGSQMSIQSQIFEVSPVNQAPVGVDAFFTYVDRPYELGIYALLENFVDLDGDRLSLVSIDNIKIDNGQNATVTIEENDVQFITPPNFTGAVSFDYTVTDGNGGYSTVRALLAPPNDEYVIVRGNDPISINLAANDFLPNPYESYDVILERNDYYNELAPIGPFRLEGGTTFSFRPEDFEVHGYLNGEWTLASYLHLPAYSVQYRVFDYSIIDRATGLVVRRGEFEIEFEGWATPGTPNSDTLLGTQFADHLGSAGGTDILIGYEGNDYYTVTSPDTIIEEGAGGGTDTVITTLNSYRLGEYLENLRFNTNGNVFAVGNSANNIIMTGGGNDQITGGAGSDRLYGEAGNDSYFVDAGDLVFENADSGYDIVYARESFTLSAGAHVEVLGTIDNTATTAINLTGNELNNYIVGNAGRNTLNGGAGGDFLDGRGGDDSYIVDAQDRVIEYADSGYDIVYARESFILSAGAHVEVLGTIDNTATTAINLTGNELNNYIVGNAGRNTLDGGAGGDFLDGRGGDDSYIVDAQDRVIEYADSGYDIVYARESFVLTAGAHVEVLGTIDNTATTAINLTGNELNNYIVGNAGRNTLDGGAGGDYLDGRSGDDSYFVDAQDRVIEYADSGYDIVYARESFVLTAGAHVEVLGTIDNTATTAINLTGNEQRNTISGNAGNNILNGGAGGDYLQGRGGADVFLFDKGTGFDAVLDFTRGEDRIDLSAFSLSFAQLQAMLTQSGTGTIITLDNGDSVYFYNTQMSQLTAGDFIL